MMLELHNHARVLRLKAHSLLSIKCTCLDPKDAPSSSSQDSTSRAVRAYSQDAPSGENTDGLGRFGHGRSWLKAGFLHA